MKTELSLRALSRETVFIEIKILSLTRGWQLAPASLPRPSPFSITDPQPTLALEDTQAAACIWRRDSGEESPKLLPRAADEPEGLVPKAEGAAGSQCLSTFPTRAEQGWPSPMPGPELPPAACYLPLVRAPVLSSCG